MSTTELRRHASNKVRHYLASIRDVRELREVMPLGTYNAESPDEAGERWRTVLHAMLLRKYLQPGDKLYLPRVVEAVLVLADGLSTEQRELLRVMKERVAVESDYVDFVVEGGVPVGEGRIHEDALYGRYMHGDFSKWEALSRTASFEMVAVRFVLADRLYAVERVAAVIEDLQEDGHLTV